MTMIDADWELCESCGKTVHVIEQYLGLCYECLHTKNLTSCSSCGELRSWEEINADPQQEYRCAECAGKDKQPHECGGFKYKTREMPR